MRTSDGSSRGSGAEVAARFGYLVGLPCCAGSRTVRRACGVPIPKTPVPASCAHFDLAAIEAQLIRTEGNVTAAATALSVPSADLCKLVWSTTSLTDVIFEQLEQMIDEAEQALRNRLKDADMGRRLQVATALLTQSAAGRKCGWGRSGTSHVEPAEPPAVMMRWLDKPNGHTPPPS
jgi:hypothetical protein